MAFSTRLSPASCPQPPDWRPAYGPEGQGRCQRVVERNGRVARGGRRHAECSRSIHQGAVSMALAVQRFNRPRQLALFPGSTSGRSPARFARRSAPLQRLPRPSVALCARCRAKEARYGFRRGDSPDRPSTLCFECFLLEISRRPATSARPERESVMQKKTALEQTLRELDLRRRRAQIAARRALASSQPPVVGLLAWPRGRAAV